MRIESDNQARNGGWTHQLIFDDEREVKPLPKPAPTAPPSASVSVNDLDTVYREFLRNLVLSHAHEAELNARGLGLTDIHLDGYKSMPTRNYASTVCRRMEKDFNLSHVPGFYRLATNWHMVDYFNATGYLIPIRNAEHKTVALQLRRDDDRAPKYLMVSSSDKPRGASSGTPPHFAYLGIPGAPSSFREIIVTEGALKANIIAAYSNTPTVGLVGVGCFDDSFPMKLKAAFPNLETVKIAFDMDAATNPTVRHQRDRLVLTLEKINLRTRILSWNRLYKGFDDYLVNQQSNLKLAA
jgi:hypothetical protein